MNRKPELAPEHFERLRKIGRDRMSTQAWEVVEMLMNQIDRHRAELLEIAESGAEHPWGGPAPFARHCLTGNSNACQQNGDSHAGD
jgi:hypothetical protein